MADELSVLNRAAAGPFLSSADKIQLNETRSDGLQVEQKIRDTLARVEAEIIVLGTATRHKARRPATTVGPEFLLASLLNNVHDRSAVERSDSKVDTSKNYRRYTDKISSRARRSPQRRQYLEIVALEEELETLRALTALQTRLLDAYEDILKPESFNLGTTEPAFHKDRGSLFGLEAKCLEAQRTRLAKRDDAYEVLTERAKSFRFDLAQSIDLLEGRQDKVANAMAAVALLSLML
ncbi:hypothetical protein ACHAQA_000850 [Verticillium albo-atrum]